MVLRYFGVEDVQAEDFAPLVDRRRGGISGGDLIRAIEARGLKVVHKDPSSTPAEVASGRPVMALIDGGSGRLHFVVIVGWSSGHVVFHDPSAGPFRVEREETFLRRSARAGNWAIVATPRADTSTPLSSFPAASAVATPAIRSSCDALVDQWIPIARGPDPQAAIEPLRSLTAVCPSDGRPWGALAGVHFRQQRWKESVDAATRAVALTPSDADAWRLLGAAWYLEDEPRRALRSWNEIREPVLDLIQIEGLARTREEFAVRALRLHPRDLVTPESLVRAERRLDALPTTGRVSVSYRPAPQGRANAVVTAAEAALIERWPILLGRVAAEGVAKRETKIRLNAPLSRGEGVELFARYAKHRPAAWISLEIPEFAFIPGVVTIKGSWDKQTYAAERAGTTSALEQVRRRGALEWSHWLRSSLRSEASVAFERLDDGRDYFAARTGLDIRAAGDRVALLGDIARFGARGDTKSSFNEGGGSIVFRSSVEPRRFDLHARVGARSAGETAPLALWPGAGTGPGRAPLMRSRKLVDDGIVTGPVFGRHLLHATIEAETLVVRLPLASLGLAAFVDWARVSDTATASGPQSSLTAIGLGLRIRSGVAGSFRLDIARRPGHAGTVFSTGVIPPWPR